MQTLDDAWNAQDLDTFAKRHKDEWSCIVYEGNLLLEIKS